MSTGTLAGDDIAVINDDCVDAEVTDIVAVDENG